MHAKDVIPTSVGLKMMGLGMLLPILFVFHGVEIWIDGESFYRVTRWSSKLHLLGVANNTHVVQLIAFAGFFHAEYLWGYFFPERSLRRMIVRGFGFIAFVATVILLFNVEPQPKPF